MSKVKQAANINTRSQSKWYYINYLRAQLILIIACVVCYGNTLFNNYALDDDLSVTQNSFIQKGVAGIPDILTHPYITTNDKSMDYRPVVGISFALEQQFFGANPHVSHFINLVLFICFVLLIYTVLVKIFRLQNVHSALPLLIALIYAVHPVHTEVVASIKNRDEILSFSFMLLVFLSVFKFFTSDKKKTLYAVAAFVFLALSYTSKMTSIPFIAVIVLTGWFYRFHQKEKTKFYIFNILLIVFSVAYFATVIYFLKREMYDLENPLIDNHDISVRLGTALETLLFYFKFVLVPYPPRFYYGYNVIPLVSLTDSVAILSLALHFALLIYGIPLFVRRQLLGFFILSYLLGMFLYSNLLIIYPGIVSERALFLPSLWLIAALVLFVYNIAAFDKLKTALTFFQQSVVAVAVVVTAAYAWLTIQRNFQWKDTMTLMTADIVHLQNSTLANYFYGSALEGEAQQSKSDSAWKYYIAKAKEHFRQAINISPVYSEAYFKMGMILEYDEQQYDSAYQYFSKAYSVAKPAPSTAMQFQLAKSYHLNKENVRADSLFADLYAKLPNDTFTLFFYTRVKYALGDTAKARAINDQLLKLAPNDYYGYWNAALMAQETGGFVAAVPYYEKAVQYGYRDRATANALINYYNSTGQTEKISVINKIVNQ